jgi:hypothetical protein
MWRLVVRTWVLRERAAQRLLDLHAGLRELAQRLSASVALVVEIDSVCFRQASFADAVLTGGGRRALRPCVRCRSQASRCRCCWQRISTALCGPRLDWVLTMPRHVRVCRDRSGLTGHQRLVDASVTLVRALPDKDMFREAYRSMVARRLLVGQATLDTEAQLAARLRVCPRVLPNPPCPHRCCQEEFGVVYARPLDAMVSDMTTSSDIATHFAASIAADGISLPLTFGVKARSHRLHGSHSPTLLTFAGAQVLNSSVWSVVSERTPVVLPPAMRACADAFARFYTENHPVRPRPPPRHWCRLALTGRQTRRLTWLHTMGTAHVRSVVTAGAAAVTVIVSTVQVCLGESAAQAQLVDTAMPGGRATAVQRRDESVAV